MANADLDILADLVARARRTGADAADAVLLDSRSLSVARRLGVTEKLERSESRDIGLRVLVGRRQSIVSGSDTSPRALAELAERAVTMARVAPEDRYSGLAEPDQIARDIPALDIYDPTEPPAEQLLALAAEAEDAALAVEGVSNSEGAEGAWGASAVSLVASNGFAGAYRRSGFSLSAVALAGSGTGMERDYDYSARTHFADLAAAREIGRTAGERAVRRLSPRRPKTARVPVVIEQRLAGGMLRHLSGAINGAAIARGTSFLKDRMGQRLFPAGTRIIDDPLRPRGSSSRPFDGEGLPAQPLTLVEDGVLQHWLLDLSTSRQLDLAPNGRASRGLSSPPSPSTTNLHMEPGTIARDAMIAEIEQGLFVTEMIGMGVNLVTGDYSRGAAGFWIENGEITYPVSEITVAGNLIDMFANLSAADDLVFRGSADAPTLRIDGMTVAGA